MTIGRFMVNGKLFCGTDLDYLGNVGRFFWAKILPDIAGVVKWMGCDESERIVTVQYMRHLYDNVYEPDKNKYGGRLEVRLPLESMFIPFDGIIVNDDTYPDQSKSHSSASAPLSVLNGDSMVPVLSRPVSSLATSPTGGEREERTRPSSSSSSISTSSAASTSIPIASSSSSSSLSSSYSAIGTDGNGNRSSIRSSCGIVEPYSHRGNEASGGKWDIVHTMTRKTIRG